MINKRATGAAFACLILAIVVCTWTGATAADNSGEQLFEGHCRTCHGSEGRGGKAPSLIPFDWSYEEALELIRRPVCDMPPVPASAVSDAQVAQIVAYLKTIK